MRAPYTWYVAQRYFYHVRKPEGRAEECNGQRNEFYVAASMAAHDRPAKSNQYINMDRRDGRRSDTAGVAHVQLGWAPLGIGLR
jgi:hypothetical protein